MIYQPEVSFYRGFPVVVAEVPEKADGKIVRTLGFDIEELNNHRLVSVGTSGIGTWLMNCEVRA